MFRLSVLFRPPITSELSFIHIIFAFLVVLLFGGFLEFLGAYLFFGFCNIRSFYFGDKSGIFEMDARPVHATLVLISP